MESTRKGLSQADARSAERARFEKYVRKTDACWEWVGSLRPNGYGQFGFRGRARRTHRVAWTIYVGPIPAGLCVLHHCDNRKCVRIDHLFLGTVADNNRDKAAKGRAPSKLTGTDVLKIRRHRAEGRSLNGLAHDFGMSVHAIWKIVHRLTWAHLPNEQAAEEKAA